jgi:hypothetical protein
MALMVAKHILDIVGIDYNSKDSVVEGFKTNELWQMGNARMHDARQASFKVHKIARECESKIERATFRTIAQAIASGHIREHAIIASDYAIKTIGLISSNNIDAISLEREWQLNELKNFL